MTLIRRVLAFLAGLGLALSVWGFISTNTLFSSNHVEAAARETGTYRMVATAMPNLLSQLVLLSPDEQAAVAPYFDSDLVKGWAQTVIPALEHYYRQGGARPTLDLSEVAVRLSAAGVPLSPEVTNRLTTPIAVSAGHLDRSISKLVRWSALARIWGPIILLAAGSLGLLVARGRRWRFVAAVLLWAALDLLIAAGLVSLAPKLVASTVVNSAAGSIASPLRSWIEAVITGPRHDLIVAMLSAVGASVVALILQFIGGLRHRKSKDA